MTKTYTLRTLGDIFEQVPTGRIKACMTEIAQGMTTIAKMRDALEAAHAVIGGAWIGMHWPESCEWVDDEAGEITIAISDDGPTGLTMKTKFNLSDGGTMLNATNQRLYDDATCELKAEIDKRMSAVQDGSDADTCFAVALFAIASAKSGEQNNA